MRKGTGGRLALMVLGLAWSGAGDALAQLPAGGGSDFPFGAVLAGVNANGPDNAGIPPTAGDASACPPASTPPPPPPFGGPCCTRPKLTGDWCGLRDQLRDQGYTFDVSATTYYQGIASGGLSHQFQFGGRNDYILNVDGQKAGLWQGLSINAHGETVYGDSVNLLTGAVVPVNIGRSLPTVNGTVTALTGLKVSQALSDNLVLFVGKINTVDNIQQPFMRFRGLDAGFMNGVFVFNPVLGRTIPYSTFGAGAVFLADGYPVATLTVYDTNDHSTTSVFNHLFDNGAVIYPTLSTQTNFFGMPGHQTVWGAYSSGRYAILNPEVLTLFPPRVPGLSPTRFVRGSWWVNYQVDQALWVDPAEPGRSRGVGGGLGLSDGNPNPVRWTAVFGVGGSSPIPGRNLDVFGVAYYYLAYSDRFNNDVRPAVAVRDEQGMEAFYTVSVTPWCHLTTDVQVITPTLRRADTAVVVGLRAKVDF
jgi:porin